MKTDKSEPEDNSMQEKNNKRFKNLLKIGEVAPNFKTVDQNGNKLILKKSKNGSLESEMNILNWMKISLDVPTGLCENPDETSDFFKPNIVMTLASAKKNLYSDFLTADIFIADLGIPKHIFEDFGFNFQIPFEKNSIIKLIVP